MLIRKTESISILNPSMFLILFIVCICMGSGCGNIEAFSRRQHDHDQIIFPATSYDVELFTRSVTRKTISLTINNPRSVLMDYLIIPVYSITDLPFSIVTDVIILPYDAYRVITDTAPQENYRHYSPFLWDDENNRTPSHVSGESK